MSENTKELRRSKSDRMIAGVCGGLAKRFGISVILIRVLFVLLLTGYGATLPIYALLWLVVPEEETAAQ